MDATPATSQRTADGRTAYRRLRRTGRVVGQQLRWRLQGAIRYRHPLHPDARILVLRDPEKPQIYEVIVEWLREHHPELLAHLDLRYLPHRVRDWSVYALCVPWLKDPVQRRSPRMYRHVSRLVQASQAHAVPVINAVDKLTNATKWEGARRIGSTGLRVPRMAPIDDPERFRADCCGIDPPLIVRDDWGHGLPMIKIASAAEARAVDLSPFERPVAVEFIDVADPRDGICRKFRYFAAGDVGVTLSIHATRDWLTRGAGSLKLPHILQEEVEYVSRPDPNHEALQRARRALELDIVAFDYGYDRCGRPIVWEANPLPTIHLPRSETYHARTDAYVRVIQAMVALYCRRAGLAVPGSIAEALYEYQDGRSA